MWMARRPLWLILLAFASGRVDESEKPPYHAVTRSKKLQPRRAAVERAAAGEAAGETPARWRRNADATEGERRLAEDDLSGLPPDAPRRATRWGLAQSEATFAAGDAWVAEDEVRSSYLQLWNATHAPTGGDDESAPEGASRIDLPYPTQTLNQPRAYCVPTYHGFPLCCRTTLSSCLIHLTEGGCIGILSDSDTCFAVHNDLQEPTRVILAGWKQASFEESQRIRMRRVTDDVNSPELPGSGSEKKGGGEDGDASDGSTRDAEETPSKSKDGDSAGSKETGPNADDASKGSGTEEGDADAAKKARSNLLRWTWGTLSADRDPRYKKPEDVTRQDKGGQGKSGDRGSGEATKPTAAFDSASAFFDMTAVYYFDPKKEKYEPKLAPQARVEPEQPYVMWNYYQPSKVRPLLAQVSRDHHAGGGVHGYTTWVKVLEYAAGWLPQRLRGLLLPDTATDPLHLWCVAPDLETCRSRCEHKGMFDKKLLYLPDYIGAAYQADGRKVTPRGLCEPLVVSRVSPIHEALEGSEITGVTYFSQVQERCCFVKVVNPEGVVELTFKDGFANRTEVELLREVP